jgi:hypothetical protein
MFDTEIAGLLLENYYSIGTTGAQAMEALWSDVAEGNFVETLEDWGITEKQLVDAISLVANMIVDQGLLFTAPQAYLR